MNNKYKNTDNYLESARKFKSPVSKDMARNIIEMSDLKNSVQKTFFSKYGVKIMAISSVLFSSLIIFAVSTGIFNDNVQNSVHLNSSLNKIQEIPEKVSNIEPKKSESLIVSTSKSQDFSANQSEIKGKPENSTSIIKGINTIKLSEKELTDFRIYIDSIDNKEKVYPGIGFWSKTGESAATYSVFTIGGGSTHQHEKLPSEKNIHFIKLYPNVITDYKGSIFVQIADALNDGSALNEFISFNNSFMDFYKLEFIEDYFPDKIPDEINLQLSELQKLLEKNSTFEEIDLTTTKQIDKLLTELNIYFTMISETGKNKYNSVKPQLSSVDTNLKTKMTIFLDHDPDSSDYKSIESMTKMGFNVIFEKHPLTMREFLNQNYSKLGSKLSDLSQMVKNYIMINKMLAIEIPINNESENGGFIFWYEPSQKLIDVLPARYRSDLSKEFKLLENEDAICGAVVQSEKSYLDIWRACSGAIENLRVFPNPVKSIFTVRFELKEKRIMKFAIHDVNGNKIKDLSQNNHLSTGTNSLTFDISQIKTGMYLIVGSSETGETVVQRIIKE
ncbi:MAG: T9SS type A sorting domain-containing protein [Candidatus Kapabacteria bacterium]|nr:T9SS type A sorting domain-containing protein [Candidatus Kapabacteria bacterium]